MERFHCRINYLLCPFPEYGYRAAILHIDIAAWHVELYFRRLARREGKREGGGVSDKGVIALLHLPKYLMYRLTYSLHANSLVVGIPRVPRS